MEQYDFKEFLKKWNDIQGFTTPQIHIGMADWLQNCYETGETRLLMMAFRASGKSTIVGLFSAWLLVRQPDFRILVLAAESSLACKMVRNIRKIIERHPDTQDIIPVKRDQWASDRFTISRKKELRDPSVLACGITGNYTGSRADIIIYDDVEVPNTSNTAIKREALRERLQESNFILAAGGTQLYIGTPHTYFSIYAKVPRQETGEDKSFLDLFKRYEVPVLDSHSQSAWNEQFPKDVIKSIKKQSGPNNFAAQMMLQPVNTVEGRLNSDLLEFYNADINYLEAGRRVYLEINNSKIVSCSAWWDPAFGNGIHRDNSVVAIIFSDENGQYYLHNLSYIQINPRENEDEATLQCQYVANLMKKFFVPSICVETNGLGKFLPAILKREISAINIPCSVIEKTSTQSKTDRILEAFDAVMAARALHVHDSVKDTPFIIEMTEWQPGKKNSQDDGLDATAGALLSEPIRIQRSVITNERRWFSGAQSYTAETDFKV